MRKAEDSAKHNFDMLAHSWNDSIKADTTDLTQENSSLSVAEEGKAVAEGDLVVTSKDLAASENALGHSWHLVLQQLLSMALQLARIRL